MEVSILMMVGGDMKQRKTPDGRLTQVSSSLVCGNGNGMATASAAKHAAVAITLETTGNCMVSRIWIGGHASCRRSGCDGEVDLARNCLNHDSVLGLFWNGEKGKEGGGI